MDHHPNHTAPSGKGVCALWAVHMAAAGRARMGAGLVIQGRLGLRPSELEDISFPHSKWGERIATCADSSLSPSLKIPLANLHAHSVLAYCEQLCDPPHGIKALELRAAERVLAIPHNSLPMYGASLLRAVGVKALVSPTLFLYLFYLCM